MLKFSPEAFEQRFGAHYLSFYHRYAQAALVLGMLLVVGDFLVDWWAHPQMVANWLRLQVCVPILAAGIGYTFLAQARRHWQPVLAGFIVALAACLFWILLRMDAEGGQGLTSWVGILNFTFLEFYCFIVLGVQFRVALVAGLAILGLFEVTLWMHPSQAALQSLYWSYHVVTLFILAAGVGWGREYIVRKDFFAQHALDTARQAAEELALAKSAFLATMSHEIRTPLNGLLGTNELLLQSPLSAQQLVWVRGAQVSGRHLLALINDVLDVSRIEAGGLSLEAVDFDLRDLIEEARLMAAQAAQAKGLTLEVSFDACHLSSRLRGDPLRLRQIVTNLVGNAVKFTERGGVALQASITPAEHGEARVRILVEDTGVGIAENALPFIFDKFAQADSSTSRRYGGTGLGLAICRDLAGLMGGSIEVQSTLGVGSRFVVELQMPVGAEVASPAALARDPREHMAEASLRGTVLLVDDHPVNRSVATGMLRSLGLQWQVAEHGAAAVAMVRQHDFDVVLMDCQMPTMDGYAATAAIRTLPQGRGAHLPIVALTANAGEEDARRCREAGMNGFITKPFTLASLAAGLQPWLQAVTAPAR